MKEAIYTISEGEYFSVGDETLRSQMTANAQVEKLKNISITKEYDNEKSVFIYKVTGE